LPIYDNSKAWLLLRSARIVFWDFDGVIKDSVAAKSDAFKALFSPYGLCVAERVHQHHQSHGGMSRFDKIPLYLKWAGETSTPERCAEFCERFGISVRKAVLESAWVPGVREYLLKNQSNQQFVLVTATPHLEIVSIVRELGIDKCFSRIAGAPLNKAQVIADVLLATGTEASTAVLLGDADADLDAAQKTGIGFILRRTPLNSVLETSSGCLSISDLAT
jgi:phosphoglycolate phosphatase-like HAD superfamily hydrolase